MKFVAVTLLTVLTFLAAVVSENNAGDIITVSVNANAVLNHVEQNITSVIVALFSQ